MEHVYATADEQFVYEKVDLEEYFEKYQKLISPYEANGTKNPKEIMFKILQLDSSEYEELSSYCNLQKYSFAEEPKPIEVDSSTKRPVLYDVPVVTPDGEKKLKTLQMLMARNNEQECTHIPKHSYRKLVGKGMKMNDLKPWHHFALVTRIYHPFKHVYGARSHRPPRCSQEVMVLGHQTLDCLRDKIICVNDLSYPGDLSETVDEIPPKKAKDIYPSGLFFIEDKFYTDMRQPNSKDYSKPIKAWARARSLKIGSAKSIHMNEAKFKDLPIRLGYPYVYLHQGNCEHLVLFSDARLINPSESLSMIDYPILLNISNQNSRYCMICGHYVARWICQNNSRIPFNVCYMCEICFKSFNYKKGKKIGNFTAYQYTDRSAIL